MQLPIGSEAIFKGVIDLLTMQGIVWEDDLGKEPKFIEIPTELKKAAEEARHHMVEEIAQLDDHLTVKYLEGVEISVDELKSALRKAVIANARCSD
jgi:elongation factor G